MGRNHAIDFIKGVGMLLIVALHIALFWKASWVVNWIINTEMRFAVPFFFVVSGYLLFNKALRHQELEKVFKSYSIKILQYYLVSVALCCAFDYFVVAPRWNMPEIFMRGYASGSFWGDFLYLGLVNPSGFQLWFLIALFWASMVIWLCCRTQMKNIRYVVVVAFALHMIGLFGETQPYSQFFELPIYPRDAIFFALFYVSLGAFWATGAINLNKYIPPKAMGWAILLCFILMLAERSVLVIPLNAGFGEYWGEYVVSTTLVTMVLFQYAVDNPQKFQNNIFTKIGERSLGVYVIHAGVINVSYMVLDIMGKDLSANPLVQIIQLLAILAVSYGLYSIFLSVQKIFKAKGIEKVV